MLTRTSCPDARVLEMLLLGLLPREQAETVESHVSTCPSCGQAIRLLPGEDPLVDAMRKARKPVVDASDRPVVDGLVVWLKRKRSTGESVTLPPETKSFDPATPTPEPTAGRQRTETMFDFLAPRQQPDEIGRLGPYRVLKVLGAGGMGVVFLADDPVLDRRVALKVIRPEQASRPGAKQRFLNEARATAKVEHDHVVTIYEADEDRGVPYLAMPLLRGEPLDDRLNRAANRPLPLAEALRIGREVADGLAAAHGKGLIHRDIKPGNIWLEGPKAGEPVVAGPTGLEHTEVSITASEEPSPTPPKAPEGESPADAAQPGTARAPRVKVLDFGLARALRGDDSNLSQPGAIVGTPAYMAPEQARPGPIDGRADLFSLGCVLYQMTTGRRPFHGDDIISTLMSVATDKPPAVRELNPEIPPRLDRLVAKLLEKKPDNRPASAAAVVTEIHKIEQDLLPKPKAGFSRRWLLLTAGVAVGLTALVFMMQPPKKGSPVTPPDPASVTFLAEDTGLPVVVQRGDSPPVEVDLKKGTAHELPPGDYVVKLTVERPGMTLLPPSFSVEAGERREVRLQVVGEIEKAGFGGVGSVKAVAMHPKKDSLLCLNGGNLGVIAVRDVLKQERLGSLELGENDTEILAVAFSPDGVQAVSGGGKKGEENPDLSIHLWDVLKYKHIDKVGEHRNFVTGLAYSPDGKRVASSSFDGTARIWDVAGRKELLSLPHAGANGRNQKVHAVAFAPDGSRIVTGAEDNLVRVWNSRALAKPQELAGHKARVLSVAFLPGGRSVVSASDDGTLMVWDLEKGTATATLSGHKTGVNSVAVSADGCRFVSGGKDGTLRLWDAASGAEVPNFTAKHTAAIHSVAISADGRYALSGGLGHPVTVRTWRLPK